MTCRVSRRRSLLGAVGLAAATLLWTAAVVLNLSPYLRGPAEYPQEWRWWLAPNFDLVPTRLWAPAAVAGAIAIWWRRTRPPARVQWGHLLALTGLGFGLVIAVQFTSAAGIPLLARLISPEYNGYFPTAVGITDVGAFLNDYASRIRPLGGRIGAHPPGNILFF